MKWAGEGTSGRTDGQMAGQADKRTSGRANSRLDWANRRAGWQTVNRHRKGEHEHTIHLYTYTPIQKKNGTEKLKNNNNKYQIAKNSTDRSYDWWLLIALVRECSCLLLFWLLFEGCAATIIAVRLLMYICMYIHMYVCVYACMCFYSFVFYLEVLKVHFTQLRSALFSSGCCCCCSHVFVRPQF